MKIELKQGRAQEFEWGGAQFKAMPAGPDIFSLSKEKVITSQNVQFFAQSQVKSKKKSSHPHITLNTYITFTPRKFCAFICGGRGSPGYAPAKIMQKQSNKCVEAFKQVNHHNTFLSFRNSIFFAKNILFMT